MTQATELRELATLLDVSSNNVGIGLPSGTPSNNLVISDGVRTSAAITAGTTALEIARTSGGDVGILINKDTSKWLIGIDNSDGNAGPLRFMYGAYNAAAHPGFGSDYSGLNLAYDGKIGIGTKTPGYELHVSGAGDIKIEDTGGGSAHLHIGASTGGLINSEWRLKTSGANDEFYIDHRYTNNDGSNNVAVSGVDSAFKINSIQSLYNDNRQPTVRPTLNLDFANSKELDSRITFYRDSIATYYDSKGTLKYANVNEPRFDHDPVTGESKGLLIEAQVANIFDYSNNPEKWSLVSTPSFDPIVNNRKSPDETFNATSLIVTGSDPYFYKNNLTLNGTYTFSYWIKAWGNAVGKHYTTRLTNISTNQSIADTLPSEWTRKTFTFTTGATTTAYVGVEAPDNSPADGDEVSIWGAQLELSAFATSYVPSDTRFTSRSSTATYYDETGILRTAPVNGARHGYKYDGRKWVETGLILESAGTNLFTLPQSTFQSGNWIVQSNVTLTPNYAVAPDGSFTACRYQDSATSGDVIYRSMSSFTNTNNKYTASCYAKANGTSEFELRIDMPTLYKATFDLSNGTITQQTAGINAFIENVGNGWYRCSISTTFNDDITNFVVSGDVESANDDILIWGAMCETGTVATSFVYEGTRAADVATSVSYTKPKDIAKINNILNEDWYNTKEGSIYVDFDPTSGSGSDAVVVGIGDGTIRGFRAPWLTGATQIRAASWSGTAYSGLHYYNSVTTTDQHKVGISFSYQDATFTSSLDGSTAQQATSWDGVETDATTMWIGGETDSNRPYTGTIGKVSIYNESLSGAELQALTENN